MQCFDKAISIYPKYAEAYYNKGKFLYYLGNYEEAQKCFEESVTISPRYQEAHYSLAVAKIKNGQIAEGLQIVKKLIMEDNKYADIACNDEELDNIRNDERFKEICE